MKSAGMLAPAVAAALAVATLAGCGGSDGDDAQPLQIQTLSNRADLISNGNALVEVVLPEGLASSALKVQLNGQDVSSAFTSSSGSQRRGLVGGLVEGRNVIVAEAQGARSAELVVTNAPRGGPILAGTQLLPLVCATRVAQPATATTAATNASGFSTEAVDAQCNIASETLYFYRTTQAACSTADPYPSPPATAPANACFKPYTVGAAAPADLASTTTEAGTTVPYIVRVERGVLNRGIYETAVLVDPARPWANGLAPQGTWIGKLHFILGGSSAQSRRQTRPASLWNHDAALAKGWMVATNGLLDGSRNTNRTVMVDTLMMMKEDVVERYGPLKHTVASGCSAGSMSAYAISSSFPGLLDGLLVSCSLNDAESSNQESTDCSLLVEAYNTPRWRDLMSTGGYSTAAINQKKATINGHPDQTACIGWFNSFSTLRLSGNWTSVREVTPANREAGIITERQLAAPVNGCQLAPSQVYDPVTNPNGARCSHFEHAVSVWGRRADGDANSTRDNTGVQYGLRALQAAAVSAEEFVVLNEIIGSANRHGQLVPERAVADMPALETAYRSGLFYDAKLLARVPIIDFRGYDDSLQPPVTNTGRSGLHQIWRSFANQQRLLNANGTYANYAMWRFGISPNGFNPSNEMATTGFFVMDEWLTALHATTTGTLAERVLASRPASAADHCLLSSDPSQSVKVTDPAVCDTDVLLKPSRSPREVAGGPRSNDVLKCQLKPLDVADYLPATLSATQLERLRAVFPGGVCDYTKPGVGAQPSWGITTFAAGPGGQPLPQAPTSVVR